MALESLDDGMPPAGRKQVLKIRSRSRFSLDELRELLLYRELFLAFAKRDITVRYRQTLLGVVWVVAQPLIGALIFAFVFGRIANLPSDGVPYVLYAFAGLVGWNLFSSTLGKVSSSLVQNQGLISKVFFPRILLPFSTVAGTLLDFCVAFAVLLVLMPLYGIVPTISILLMPISVLILLLLALGVGLFCAAAMVTYRDVGYMVPVATQFLLYASPVAYGLSAVPVEYRRLFLLNPLAPVIETMRVAILGVGQVPVAALLVSSAVALALFFLGAAVFRRMERGFADVI